MDPIEENKILRKDLAKAKAEFENLVIVFEACSQILQGNVGGNKNVYNIVEKAVFKANKFFSNIKNIKELVAEEIKNIPHTQN